MMISDGDRIKALCSAGGHKLMCVFIAVDFCAWAHARPVQVSWRVDLKVTLMKMSTFVHIVLCAT